MQLHTRAKGEEAGCQENSMKQVYPPTFAKQNYSSVLKGRRQDARRTP